MGDQPPNYSQLYPNLPPPGGPFYGQPPPGVYTGTAATAHHPPESYHGDSRASASSKQKGDGLFGSILTTAGKVVSNAGKLATSALHELGSTVDKYAESQTTKLFQTNNIVQLISRSTGHNLQIVVASNGQLVLDGLGPDSPQAFNTHFTITRPKHNLVYLHNNFNYVAIVNGTAVIHQAGQSGSPTPNCQFAIHEPTLNFISLESTLEKFCCLGVLTTGQMKPALATTSADKDSHFGVRLVSSPYGPTGIPPKPPKT